MRIFTEKTLKDFSEKHPDALLPLQVWVDIVKNSQWTCYADVKRTFNSVDAIGNQRYVFNVKGNSYRIVAVIKFTIGFIYIRFIGTHKEYDNINCLII
ncbi:MAG: type II toxin-antitoxin system HigB family toxin [Bacteroidaceae bacterium]|nr:type II toxin-antitoxin system HigB family toxin [Bacteroidaceae bacterium]